MAYTYFPFDSGAGANVTEQQWWKMGRLWRSTGLIVTGTTLDAMGTGTGDLSVNPGTGLSVNVRPGAAWIEGHYFVSDAMITKTLAAADPTNPRIDRIVVRADWVANQITIEVLQGTPNATPSPPTLTQTSGTRYELPIAQVRVNAGATSIATTDITDERVISSWAGYLPACQVTNNTNINIAAGATTTLTWNTEKFDNAQMHSTASNTDKIYVYEDGIYYVEGMIFWKQPSSQNVAGTVNTSIYRQNGANTYQVIRDTRYIQLSQAVQSFSKLVFANAGDYFYMQATNNTSLSLDVDSATPYSPYFSVIKLGITTGYSTY